MDHPPCVTGRSLQRDLGSKGARIASVRLALSALAPPAIVSVGLLLATAAMVELCRRATGGEWAYGLDDTYIHLELAWRLIQDGTWGINPGEPASASSSPLWSLILALGLGLAGHQVHVPLVLGALCGVGGVWAGAAYLRSAGVGIAVMWAGLLALTALAPLPIMAALGMEHALQIALTLLVVRAAEQDLTLSGSSTTNRWTGLVALALLCTTRFEGLFLGLVWGLLAARSRGLAAGLPMLATAGLPGLLFAAFSLSIGNAALPNGMLMKSTLFSSQPWMNLLDNTRQGAAILLPTVLVWVLDATRGGTFLGSTRARLLAGTVALHLSLAAVGWYYRYEAWLVAWAILAAAASASSWFSRHPRAGRQIGTLPILVLTLGSAWALADRASDAWRYLPGRATYVADAKVRLARALEAVAPTTVVALHDIGAMAWETDLRIVDTAGLGSNDALALHRQRRFTGETIAEVSASHGAEVGLGTWSWMEHDRPAGWRPVARFVWSLDPVRKNEPIVAYAIAPGSEEVARAWLEEAVSAMGGRGALEVLDGDTWVPVAPR